MTLGNVTSPSEQQKSFLAARSLKDAVQLIDLFKPCTSILSLVPFEFPKEHLTRKNCELISSSDLDSLHLEHKLGHYFDCVLVPVPADGALFKQGFVDKVLALSKPSARFFFINGIQNIGLAFFRPIVLGVGDPVSSVVTESGFTLSEMWKSSEEVALAMACYPLEKLALPTKIMRLGTSWREAPQNTSKGFFKNAMEFSGITRLARIDGLIGMSVPIYSASRPLSKVEITVVGGKGITPDQSKLSAIFEGVEVAAAERELRHCIATPREIGNSHIPMLEMEALATTYEPSERIPWVLVHEYPSGHPYWCPEVAVGLLPVEGPFRPMSNGLASGSTFFEALLHGLLEVLERHVHSLALVRRDCVTTDLGSIKDPFCEDLFAQVAAKGLRFEIKDISGPIGIPAFFAMLLNLSERDSHLIGGGLGCHPDPEIALRRSLLEAVQSRSIAVAGGREDIESKPRVKEDRFQKVVEMYRFWYEPTSDQIPLPVCSIDPTVPTLDEVLDQVLATVRGNDPFLGRLYYYCFPSPQGTWVIRSILEGAEIFDFAPTRLGPQLSPILGGIDT